MKSISFPAMKFIELMIDSGIINLAAIAVAFNFPLNSDWLAVID